MKWLILSKIFLLFHFCLFAQKNDTYPDQKTSWKIEETDDYLNQQVKVTMKLVVDVLTMNPPAIDEQLSRKMALFMVDNVLHDEHAAKRPAVQEFFQKQINNAVEEIITHKVENGAVIWKLYNHTFVVKTASVTIGFDITRGLRGMDGLTLPENLVNRLINVTDILFVTHIHEDHADPWVAERFLFQNKPVITPVDMWVSLPFYNKLHHPERDAHKIQDIYVSTKKLNLSIVNYPGHQGANTPNNVYLVFSPEGMAFCHTGDQYFREDYEWIDQVHNFFEIDVLLVNCWTIEPARLVYGFQPRLIITGHENEIGHPITQRKPYWLNYMTWQMDNRPPFLQMVWGEKFHYLPNLFN